MSSTARTDVKLGVTLLCIVTPPAHILATHCLHEMPAGRIEGQRIRNIRHCVYDVLIVCHSFQMMSEDLCINKAPVKPKPCDTLFSFIKEEIKEEFAVSTHFCVKEHPNGWILSWKLAGVEVVGLMDKRWQRSQWCSSVAVRSGRCVRVSVCVTLDERSVGRVLEALAKAIPRLPVAVAVLSLFDRDKRRTVTNSSAACSLLRAKRTDELLFSSVVCVDGCGEFKFSLLSISSSICRVQFCLSDKDEGEPSMIRFDCCTENWFGSSYILYGRPIQNICLGGGTVEWHVCPADCFAAPVPTAQVPLDWRVEFACEVLGVFSGGPFAEQYFLQYRIVSFHNTGQRLKQVDRHDGGYWCTMRVVHPSWQVDPTKSVPSVVALPFLPPGARNGWPSNIGEGPNVSQCVADYATGSSFGVDWRGSSAPRGSNEISGEVQAQHLDPWHEQHSGEQCDLGILLVAASCGTLLYLPRVSCMVPVAHQAKINIIGASWPRVESVCSCTRATLVPIKTETGSTAVKEEITIEDNWPCWQSGEVDSGTHELYSVIVGIIWAIQMLLHILDTLLNSDTTLMSGFKFFVDKYGFQSQSPGTVSIHKVHRSAGQHSVNTAQPAPGRPATYREPVRGGKSSVRPQTQTQPRWKQENGNGHTQRQSFLTVGQHEILTQHRIPSRKRSSNSVFIQTSCYLTFSYFQVKSYLIQEAALSSSIHGGSGELTFDGCFAFWVGFFGPHQEFLLGVPPNVRVMGNSRGIKPQGELDCECLPPREHSLAHHEDCQVRDSSSSCLRYERPRGNGLVGLCSWMYMWGGEAIWRFSTVGGGIRFQLPSRQLCGWYTLLQLDDQQLKLGGEIGRGPGAVTSGTGNGGELSETVLSNWGLLELNKSVWRAIRLGDSLRGPTDENDGLELECVCMQACVFQNRPGYGCCGYLWSICCWCWSKLLQAAGWESWWSSQTQESPLTIAVGGLTSSGKSILDVSYIVQISPGGWLSSVACGVAHFLSHLVNADDKFTSARDWVDVTSLGAGVLQSCGDFANFLIEVDCSLAHLVKQFVVRGINPVATWNYICRFGPVPCFSALSDGAKSARRVRRCVAQQCGMRHSFWIHASSVACMASWSLEWPVSGRVAYSYCHWVNCLSSSLPLPLRSGLVATGCLGSSAGCRSLFAFTSGRSVWGSRDNGEGSYKRHHRIAAPLLPRDVTPIKPRAEVVNLSPASTQDDNQDLLLSCSLQRLYLTCSLRRPSEMDIPKLLGVRCFLAYPQQRPNSLLHISQSVPRACLKKTYPLVLHVSRKERGLVKIAVGSTRQLTLQLQIEVETTCEDAPPLSNPGITLHSISPNIPLDHSSELDTYLGICWQWHDLDDLQPETPSPSATISPPWKDKVMSPQNSYTIHTASGKVIRIKLPPKPTSKPHVVSTQLNLIPGHRLTRLNQIELASPAESPTPIIVET
ncbi:hypothetical protein PR048_009524 [Dryococelus australis]|uniref:Uncharacterized protein n=1 Tax=Dryococelus australis TaxID=614101 RepID=A0ABQ9I1Z1_9NEOP|nr:hypothetical protein PR048_009524 [Dryococelus australis]